MMILQSMIFVSAMGLSMYQACATPIEIQAKGPEGPLKGTLIAAQNPAAKMALIIPGSGPTDRDGNNPYGLQTNTYKLLAQDLAAHGLTTLRIDKRGMFGSAKAVANPNAVTIDDYADDVGNWVSTLRKQYDAQCVWLIGHSEGGLVALAAAQKVQNLCGIVLVATAGRPLGVLLKEQLESNPANSSILAEAKTLLKQLELGQHVDGEKISPALLPLFHPQVQNYLINTLKIDPAKLIGKIDLPILILQGERDIQVGIEDANLLKQSARNAQLHLIKNANHILKPVHTNDRNANLQTYANPLLPLADGVISAIAEFIHQHYRSFD